MSKQSKQPQKSQSPAGETPPSAAPALVRHGHQHGNKAYLPAPTGHEGARYEGDSHSGDNPVHHSNGPNVPSGKAATSYRQSVPGHDAEPGHIGMDYLNEGRRKAKK